MEARNSQPAESMRRGQHEQAIRRADSLVQSYLSAMRRTVRRFHRLVATSPQALAAQPEQQEVAQVDQRRPLATVTSAEALVAEVDQLGGRFRAFNLQWARAVGKQQSPLIDRIPPRGVELWRDFWDTVRKQVRRINQEFVQVSRDMTRVITGRPVGSSRPTRDQHTALLYTDSASVASQSNAKEQLEEQQEKLRQQFQQFYDKLTVSLSKEQEKLDNQLAAQSSADSSSQTQVNELFDEQDDEATRNELNRNVALRQQIQQEINVFGSIFDIMRQFIQRLRESATHIRDVLTPPGSSNNNDAVTPGPSVKPTVDQLLEDTINSQRNINGQAKPVMLPNARPKNNAH